MTTPVRRQYLRIKKRFPDTVVLFRLGDFYETFDDDARLVSQVCDIVLTSRPVGTGERVPLAGVPYHAVESYLARLISAGHKVAIVEQLDQQESRGLMGREVVRVVTPGTVVEPSLLEEKRNNYLAALAIQSERVGLAFADITTGEFRTTQFDGALAREMAWQELERLQPAEVLVSEKVQVAPERAQKYAFSAYAAWHFDHGNAERALLEHFGVASLDGYGCAGLPLAVSAAGAIVQYLQETQKAALEQLTQLATYSTQTFMTLDAATRRNLELTHTIRSGEVRGSLLGVLDDTRTAMGARLLRQRISQPLLDLPALQQRLDSVQAFVEDTPRRTSLRALLKRVGDVERLTNRAVQRIAGPRDLLGLRDSLLAVAEIGPVLGEMKAGASAPSPGGASRPPSRGAERQESTEAEKAEAMLQQSKAEGLPQSQGGMDANPEVVKLISQAILPDAPATLAAGGVIAPGFSAELDAVLGSAREAKAWVAGLERAERERTGIRSLKVGYNKVFGYYIEVTRANLEAVPEDYIRKQTLVNGERFITPELKEREALILNAEERRAELERQIYLQVLEQVAAAAPRLLATARILAEVDVDSALAEVALSRRYVRPALTTDQAIHIVNGRHPVVELTLHEEPFVPNDTHLSPEEAILVITGPNMSGKSTYLRQVALIVLLAQIGSFVPADSAEIGLVDRIFTRVGAQDEISAGQSTFMVEMVEAANILNHATGRSLLILDEIGRGTSTYDGISIAWAMVEYIHNHPRLQSKTLFATHYHELVELARFLPRVRNYNVAVAEEGERVVFLRRILPGGADRSYGIHVAQLAGLPKPVIRRAEEILKNLEQEVQRSPGSVPRRVTQVQQLSLFPASNPALDELKALDISSMSPLEAINKLYELQEKAKGS
ncbi:MAG: DNA mismatch repair protein MutS [Chloroflexi bacterium]|nr:DNA mismatch repair protein MutS [Chloroflexota bacterium]